MLVGKGCSKYRSESLCIQITFLEFFIFSPFWTTEVCWFIYTADQDQKCYNFSLDNCFLKQFVFLIARKTDAKVSNKYGKEGTHRTLKRCVGEQQGKGRGAGGKNAIFAKLFWKPWNWDTISKFSIYTTLAELSQYLNIFVHNLIMVHCRKN